MFSIWYRNESKYIPVISKTSPPGWECGVLSCNKLENIDHVDTVVFWEVQFFAYLGKIWRVGGFGPANPFVGRIEEFVRQIKRPHKIKD